MRAFNAAAFFDGAFEIPREYAFNTAAFAQSSFYTPVQTDKRGRFYPRARTTDAIQEALDAATKAGGGDVILDSGQTYGGISGLQVDCTIHSLIGNDVTIDWSAAAPMTCLQVTETPNGVLKRTVGGRIQGVRLLVGANQTGLQLKTLAGGDRRANTSFYDVTIDGGGRANTIGIENADNAYIMAFFRACVVNCNKGLYRLTSNNNGENLAFYSSVFAGNNRAFDIRGPNFDAYFFGTSFDYNGSNGYTDAVLMFHGCHFEKAPPTSGKYDFEMDNGGRLGFYGCNVGWAAGAGGGTIFQSWGTGGGYVRNYGQAIAAPSGCTLINDASRLTQI